MSTCGKPLFEEQRIALQFHFYVHKNKNDLKRCTQALVQMLILPKKKCTEFDILREETVFTFLFTVKPALNDHRFKRPPAFSDRFFMHGESAIQTALC